MDSYIDNMGGFDGHPFIEKLDSSTLVSFINSQKSMMGFYDNWLRMVGGFIVKVPEKERDCIINYLFLSINI